ncbi:MAG TPA: translation elongation factor Ts [Minicystis sp.]|nr:translation elongation factor Ts [Minicystis sp.]
MAVNASAIKELRERTQAGMSDCKVALEEAGGDMEKAVEVILKKGLAKSAKKAGNVASEGEIRASVSSDKRAATIVEVNIQTDFSARNEAFKKFVADVHAIAEKSAPGTDLSTQSMAGKTVGEIAAELTGKIGEKIHVRRWGRLEVPAGKHGLCASYVHFNSRIGVIVELQTESAAAASHAETAKFADEVCTQIASMRATVVKRDEVAADVIAKQKEIFEAQLKEDPKTAAKQANWPKMIEGKVNKWFSECALLEQESAEKPGQTIDKLREAAGKAAGAPIQVVKFLRYELGEGIEKKTDDFAAEVAKMAGG